MNGPMRLRQHGTLFCLFIKNLHLVQIFYEQAWYLPPCRRQNSLSGQRPCTLCSEQELRGRPSAGWDAPPAGWNVTCFFRNMWLTDTTYAVGFKPGVCLDKWPNAPPAG